MSKLTETLQTTLGATLPSVMGALGILVLGWFVAMAVREPESEKDSAC